MPAPVKERKPATVAEIAAVVVPAKVCSVMVRDTRSSRDVLAIAQQVEVLEVVADSDFAVHRRRISREVKNSLIQH